VKKKKRKAKRKQPEFEKTFMLCREVTFGTYVIADCGAIHTTLKSAKEHLVDCCTDSSELLIIPCYRVKPK